MFPSHDRLGDNGLVKKEDDQLIFNREVLEAFIKQELSKAREEGRRETLLEMQRGFSEYGVPDDVRYTHSLLKIAHRFLKIQERKF